MGINASNHVYFLNRRRAPKCPVDRIAIKKSKVSQQQESAYIAAGNASKLMPKGNVGNKAGWGFWSGTEIHLARHPHHLAYSTAQR